MGNSSIKILIADDENIGRQLLEAILMPEDFNLVMACDGKEALEMALSENPDVILLDVMMPHMDGFEVCKRIRKEPSVAHVPVFLITALDDRDSKLRGIDAGADDYISKPYDRIEILAKVKNSITRIQQQKLDENETGNIQTVTENTGNSILLTEALLELLLSNTSASAEVYSSPMFPTPESKHCFVTQGDYSLFLTNKLDNKEAALANGIFISIWKDTLDSTPGELNSILIKCIENFNQLIRNKRLELLSKAGFSLALIKYNNNDKELQACGIDQNIYVRSQEISIGETANDSYQSYYLQSNQVLKFNSAQCAVIISPNAYKIIEKSEFLKFTNANLLNIEKGSFPKIIAEKFNQTKDIFSVKITF